MSVCSEISEHVLRLHDSFDFARSHISLLFSFQFLCITLDITVQLISSHAVFIES